MRNIIILLGPPGAGKGSLGGRLASLLGLPLISSGDLLRENVKKNTPFGKKAKKYMDLGELVPDKIVIEMIKEKISEDRAKDGFILDGFPRTLAQAEMLDKIISDNNSMKVFYLKADDDFLLNRLLNRRVCEKCGKIYHLVNFPPKTKETCDICGGHLVQRKDDTEDVIRKRLEIYKQLTTPLLDYYKKKNVLYVIAGDINLEYMIDAVKKIIKW